jgi:hypothetical protein
MGGNMEAYSDAMYESRRYREEQFRKESAKALNQMDPGAKESFLVDLTREAAEAVYNTPKSNNLSLADADLIRLAKGSAPHLPPAKHVAVWEIFLRLHRVDQDHVEVSPKGDLSNRVNTAMAAHRHKP